MYIVAKIFEAIDSFSPNVLRFQALRIYLHVSNAYLCFLKMNLESSFLFEKICLFNSGGKMFRQDCHFIGATRQSIITPFFDLAVGKLFFLLIIGPSPMRIERPGESPSSCLIAVLISNSLEICLMNFISEQAELKFA